MKTDGWEEAGATPEEREAFTRGFDQVSPRSAERLGRVWAAMEKRDRTSRERTKLAFAAAVALAAFVVGARLGDRPEHRPMTLHAGLSVELPEGGELARNDTGEYVLESGKARITLSRDRSDHAPIRFHAGDLTVDVVGTVFALQVVDGHGSVRVYEGAVMAHVDGRSERVDATKMAFPRPESASQFQADDNWGAAEASLREAPSRRPLELQMAVQGPGTVQVTSPGSTDVAKVASLALPKETPKTVVRAEVAPKETSAASEPGKRESAEIVPEAAEVPAVSASVMGPENVVIASEIELYQRALISLRLGRASIAADQFDAYLTRYPSGALVEEAELSRLEALQAAGRSDALDVAISGWLSRHPDHPRREEVWALRSKAKSF